MYTNVSHKISVLFLSHELVEDSVEVVGDLLDLGLLNHQVLLHLLCGI